MYSDNKAVADDKLKHRIGAREVKLVGLDGNPIANKEVKVRQTNHKFLFGGSEFNSVFYADLEGEMKQKVGERIEKFCNIFNFATLPFYWGNFEREKGKPETKRLRRGAEMLKANGLKLKGHPLCWHTVCADWLMEMSNEDILKTQLNRINREVTEFKGLIDMWDVINEVVIMPIFDKYDNGITRICKEMGRINLVREVFKAAKEANPGATLIINDFNLSESYDILLEGLLEAGIPIDAIGIQTHMHQGYIGVERTMEILERFSRFKLPIHFTENTLVSGHIMPPEIEDLNDYQIPEWPTTPEGEERQAREAVTHYTTLFNHPSVESITWWDFADGMWLGAPSGLLTKDNRVKPIYDELYNLIKGKWWTGEYTAVTNEAGMLTAEGFMGEYQLECDGKKVPFTIDKTSEVCTLNL